eukprot:COSAG05_NODE_4487_length_1492_cov_8.058866_1_plen_204_part_00
MSYTSIAALSLTRSKEYTPLLSRELAPHLVPLTQLVNRKSGSRAGTCWLCTAETDTICQSSAMPLRLTNSRGFVPQDGADFRVGVHPQFELEVGPRDIERVIDERIDLWYDALCGWGDLRVGRTDYISHGDALLPLPLFRVVNHVAIPKEKGERTPRPRAGRHNESKTNGGKKNAANKPAWTSEAAELSPAMLPPTAAAAGAP